MLSDCYLTLEICYYLCKKINMKGRHIKILTIDVYKRQLSDYELYRVLYLSTLASV